MSLIEKLHTLIISIAVVLGLAFGQISFIEVYAHYFIVPFLLLMLYGLFLGVPVKDLKKAFVNSSFAGASLSINFLWTPVLAWALGFVFLSEHPSLWIGFIMLMVTPCTDWYLVFTGMARGNLLLSTAILPVNLILQVFLLPIYLLIFAGVIKAVEMSVLLESLLLILALPFLLANVTRLLAEKHGKQAFLEEKLIPFFSSTQIIFLSLAIFAMFASQGKYLLANISLLYLLLIPILLFFLINFILVRIVSNILKFKYEDSVSLHLTTLARNSPLALAIAVSAFPNEPLIALALVIGPLIELPLLAIVAQLLLVIGKKTTP